MSGVHSTRILHLPVSWSQIQTSLAVWNPSAVLMSPPVESRFPFPPTVPTRHRPEWFSQFTPPHPQTRSLEIGSFWTTLLVFLNHPPSHRMETETVRLFVLVWLSDNGPFFTKMVKCYSDSGSHKMSIEMVRIYITVSQEPQCARFCRILTCSPIV